ncbi:MAG: hypothetical protein WAZ18_02850 [Alphaproteobacteria bacterium]
MLDKPVSLSRLTVARRATCLVVSPYGFRVFGSWGGRGDGQLMELADVGFQGLSWDVHGAELEKVVKAMHARLEDPMRVLEIQAAHRLERAFGLHYNLLVALAEYVDGR